MIKQDNEATETEIDGDALAKVLYDHSISGTKGELKFWWHSHVNMGVFWSGTDMKTIEDLTQNGWFIHGVFNKKGENRIAYSNNEPVEVFIDNLELEIDEDMVSDEKLELLLEIEELENMIGELDKKLGADCDKLYDELVTNVTYKPAWKGAHNAYGAQYYNQNKGSWQGKSSTGYQTAGNTQSTSMTHTTGQATSNGYSDDINYKDHAGAAELIQMGFTEEEVKYMQNTLWILDAEDLVHYEVQWGDVHEELAWFRANKEDARFLMGY